MNQIICAVCDQLISDDDLDNRHWWHEKDCPNFRRNLGLDESDEDFWCDCDIETHEGCIPDWIPPEWSKGAA